MIFGKEQHHTKCTVANQFISAVGYNQGLYMPSMGRNPCFIRKVRNFSRFSAQINRDSPHVKKDIQALLVRRKIL